MPVTKFHGLLLCEQLRQHEAENLHDVEMSMRLRKIHVRPKIDPTKGAA